jgi:hypothetical protein
MKSALTNDPSQERYVVEIDGIAKFEHRVFVKALSVSLQLKQEFPSSSIKLRDAVEASTDPLVLQRIHILLDPRMGNKPEFNWNVQPDGRQTEESF